MTLKIQNTDLFKDLNQDNEVVLDNEIKHLFDKTDLLAIWSAYQSGRPLLLRGKPGTGKSQLAKAIAYLLDWEFVSEVMHGGTQLEELHWHYDAISRLGEAQSLAYTLGLKDPKDKDTVTKNQDKTKESTNENVQEKLQHKHFIRPGVFWWAFDWSTATTCDSNANLKNEGNSDQQEQEKKPNGVVLLIDEIDKAEPDLPNGLLQTLGDLAFTVPYINETIKAGADKPLIIITTNEERELPTALVRRCFTHTLKMAEGENKIDWLIKRGQLHFKEQVSTDSYRQAAELLWQDRSSDMRYPPGLAEYLDLLRALATLSHDEQEKRLREISQFVYKKEAEE